MSRIYDPGTSAAGLAVLLGEHYRGVPVAGWLAAALLREGSSLGRLQDAAGLMLSGQDASSLTGLTFAAAVAGAAGDAGEERRLIGQALAAEEAGDPGVRLEVVDFIGASGHAAEAVELLEPGLKEAPDDDFSPGSARRSSGPTPQPAQMKPPPGSAPRWTGSPTARAWLRSGTPGGTSGSLAMVQALAGEPGVPPAATPFGRAEPHGVYAGDREPVSAEMASLAGKVAGAMITRIAADVHRYRAAPPAIASTGGDPMCLIGVTIAVEEGTAGQLAARPGFDRDSDQPDRVTWWGALIPDGQREAMMAQAIAQLRVQGHQDAETPEGPQRWVRGVLQIRDREITVEVNSQHRLTRLLDILRKIGGNPVVTSEKRIDPAMDFAWPVGQRASQGGTAAAAEGWEKFWLDEKVPALPGRTPGQAARGRDRPYLEAMLRQFEYEAGLLAADGKTGVDTAWLREQPGMPGDLAD
ncbi:MAG: hypothetical protein ACRDOD_01335 [Streptosporangiaceae bacterium]